MGMITGRAPPSHEPIHSAPGRVESSQFSRCVHGPEAQDSVPSQRWRGRGGVGAAGLEGDLGEVSRGWGLCLHNLEVFRPRKALRDMFSL